MNDFRFDNEISFEICPSLHITADSSNVGTVLTSVCLTIFCMIIKMVIGQLSEIRFYEPIDRK